MSALSALSGRPEDILFSMDVNTTVPLTFFTRVSGKEPPADCVSEPIVIKSLCDILCTDDRDRCLCPVRCLKHYLKRTRSIRSGKRKLFLSINPEYRQDVRTNTFSRWIVSIIKEAYAHADVSLESVRAHEVRAISMSLALARGVSLQAIMKAAYWRSSATFLNFYLRDVSAQTQAGDFVLNSVVLAQNTC